MRTIGPAVGVIALSIGMFFLGRATITTANAVARLSVRVDAEEERSVELRRRLDRLEGR